MLDEHWTDYLWSQFDLRWLLQQTDIKKHIDFNSVKFTDVDYKEEAEVNP